MDLDNGMLKWIKFISTFCSLFMTFGFSLESRLEVIEYNCGCEEQIGETSWILALG